MRYTVVIEDAGRNFSAYVPDVPGVIATGETREQTLANMRDALVFHIETLRELGQAVPSPTTRAAEIEAA